MKKSIFFNYSSKRDRIVFFLNLSFFWTKKSYSKFKKLFWLLLTNEEQENKIFSTRKSNCYYFHNMHIFHIANGMNFS